MGCGTGTLTVQLADLCHKVEGVDSSQSMIEKAKQQFNNIEFIQDTVCKKVEDLTRGTLWNGEAWVADYRRLRVIAHI